MYVRINLRADATLPDSFTSRYQKIRHIGKKKPVYVIYENEDEEDLDTTWKTLSEAQVAFTGYHGPEGEVSDEIFASIGDEAMQMQCDITGDPILHVEDLKYPVLIRTHRDRLAIWKKAIDVIFKEDLIFSSRFEVHPLDQTIETLGKIALLMQEDAD